MAAPAGLNGSATEYRASASIWRIRLPSSDRSGLVRGRAASSCALMEKLHRVDDGLQHVECQRNSDEALGWHELQSRRTTLWIRALERI